jgi:hypothetical protein
MLGSLERASLRTVPCSSTRTTSRTLFHRIPNSTLRPDADGCLHSICCAWCHRPDDLQSLSFSLCHNYAPCTHSISVPAPFYCKSPLILSLTRQCNDSLTMPVLQNSDAPNVCGRVKNHYDPQESQRLFASDVAPENITDPSGAGILASEDEFAKRC